MSFFGKFILPVVGVTLAFASLANAQTTPAPVETDASTSSFTLPSWTKRISISGDYRFRIEHDIFGNYSSSPAGAGNKLGTDDFGRIAVRLGAKAQITDSLVAVTRLSSGTRQFSPWTSLGTNNYAEQSASGALGTGFSQRRDFFLDLAYLNYTPDPSLVLQLGKEPIIFWTPGGSMLVWNLFYSTMEGGQFKWVGDFGSLHPWIAGGYSVALNRVDGTDYIVSSPATDGPPITMLGGQIGLTWRGEHQWIAGDVGSYNYNNIRTTPGQTTGSGSAPSATAGIPTGDSSSMNNSVDSAGKFMYDYQMVQGGLEYGYKFSWGPAKVYADYVQNTMTSSDNIGTQVGIVVGKLVDKGDWYGTISYRDLRKDATVGAYSDVTFFAGGTDVLGEDIEVGYQYWDKGGFLGVVDFGKKYLNINGGLPFESYIFDVYASF